VYVEGDATLRDRVAGQLEADEFAVETVPDVAGVLEALEDDESVDCVLTGAALADGDWRDLVDAVRDRDPDLPIALYPPEVDPDVGRRAAVAGVTAYLPEPWDEGTALQDQLAAAADEFDRIRRVRAESERYDALMETLPFSVYLKDRDARYVDASKPFREAISGDVVGKTDVDLWEETSGETGVDSYQDDLAVLRTGEPIVRKEEFHEGGSDDGWMETSKYPWRGDDGEIRGLVGMTLNVTAQRERTRELRRKSQRLEQFASFVSHDLRNPINIAQGYLDRAVETGDETALEEVEDALSRMDHLVEDLLTTVRRGEESTEWIEFRAFVQRIWTATETEHTSLEVEIPEDTTIAAVPGQFRQLLDNLFRNADEHASTSPPSHTREDADEHASTSPPSHAREDADEHASEDVTVTVGLTEDGFYLADDGPGIGPELRESVFEFGHSEDGTGIGLTITREIAAAHGWDVEITESEDGGARFEFSNCLLRREGYGSLEEAEEVPIDETTAIGDSATRGHLDPPDDGTTWTIAGGGENLWRDEEEHFFAYGTVDEDVRIVARVTDLEPVHRYSKAGVMVRGWPGEGSPLAYAGVTPGEGTEVIYRSFPSDDIVTDQYVDTGNAPRWYRLDWIDNMVTFLTSPDGEDWTTLDTQPIAAQDPLTVGLAVCSHSTERTAEATFENVRAVRLRTGGSDDAGD